MIYVIILSIISYLIGSLPFALTIGKRFSKKDIRIIGSKNQGATNVYRAGGFKLGAIVFFLDFLKGFLALFIWSYFFDKSDFTIIFPAVFVVLGHIFSIFTKFKGGKGISTASGVICFINPLVFALSFTIFWITFYFKRTTSISSVFALLTLLLSSFFLYYFKQLPVNLPIISTILAIIIVFAHRDNFKRLKNGNEFKF